jgi:DNA-binding MarR family transcriptional regulator
MFGDMTTDPRLAPEVMLPVLLKPGRGVYGLFIRDALAAAGFTDMPANGGYVLGIVAPGGSPLSDIIADLGVSKQNARELVDTLVVRGYLERTADPRDERRVLLARTDRGQAASDAVLAAAEDVDRRLVAMVGPERVAHTKETLAALLALRSEAAPGQ